MCACVRVRACVRACACVGGCHVCSWGLESLRVGRWYSVGVFHYPNLAHERGKNETTSWFEYKAPPSSRSSARGRKDRAPGRSGFWISVSQWVFHVFAHRYLAGVGPEKGPRDIADRTADGNTRSERSGDNQCVY